MACLIFKTEKPIEKEEDFVDFYDKEKWGKNTYPFVEHHDPSCLAWIGKLSFWLENDAIELKVQEATGITPDEQILLDEMPKVAHDLWIEFTRKIAAITDETIEAELPGLIARMPDWQTKDKAVWRTYFTLKRDYMKAILKAGIEKVEVFV